MSWEWTGAGWSFPEVTEERRKKPGGGFRVLVVDDEPDVLRVLERHLARNGFAVTACLSGQQALSAFAPHRFQLVVTDMRMPGIDGMTLLRAIRRIDPLVPAIVLTGYGTLDNAIDAFREGKVSNYLLKPMKDINDLSVAAREAVDQERQRRHSEAAHLRRSLLGQIIEWSDEPVLLCRSDGTVAAANRSAQQTFGDDRRPVEGRRLDSLAPRRSKHRRKLAEMLSQASVRRSSVKGRVDMVSASGTRMPISVSISPLSGAAELKGTLAVTCSGQEVPSHGAQATGEALTDREEQVAQMITAGLSNREISERLFVTEATVKTHVSAVLRKLGLRDRLQLALYFLSVTSKP